MCDFRVWKELAALLIMACHLIRRALPRGITNCDFCRTKNHFSCKLGTDSQMTGTTTMDFPGVPGVAYNVQHTNTPISTEDTTEEPVTKYTFMSELIINIIKLESVRQHHEIELDKSHWHGPATHVRLDDVDYTRHDADYESDLTRSEETSNSVTSLDETGVKDIMLEPCQEVEEVIDVVDVDTVSSSIPLLPLPAMWLRTVLFIKKVTVPGQDLFIRGGLSTNTDYGDQNNNVRKDGSIAIQYESLGTTPHYNKYDSWRKGVTKFDWYGCEGGQGSFEGLPAVGAPGAWTSNKTDVVEYQPLNTFGEHYWMLDFLMDYTQTRNGWFEFRCFLTQGDGWESAIFQDDLCSGTAGGVTPYKSTNHMARCGYMNVFEFNKPTCRIDEI